MTSNSELIPEMQTLIAQELELNGVNLNKNIWLSSESVLQEISLILASPAHEGRVPSSGVMFVEDVTELTGAERIALPAKDIELTRMLANGIDYFLLYERDRFFGLAYFKEPLATELQLVRNFPASGGMLVQRGPTGSTKFFQGDSITLHENRVWRIKSHVKEAAWKVSQCLSSVDRHVLNRILELSFHLLSPTSRVGATLVWCMRPPMEDILEGLSVGHELASLHLSILNEAHSTAICHLLSGVDGATFLDPLGNLISTGVHLKYSDQSRDFVPEFKGTRHTSAKRFSFDKENALVVTISEDGPVTVFSNGASIANLSIHSSYKEAKKLKAKAPEKREDITSSSYETICKHCGKTSMLEQINVEGFEEDWNVNCPVCQAHLHHSFCFSLECRPFRRLAEVVMPPAG